jgi:hypothetical protein
MRDEKTSADVCKEEKMNLKIDRWNLLVLGLIAIILALAIGASYWFIYGGM